MPTKFMRTLILVLTILAIFAWTSSPLLKAYNLQLTGALILLYFATKYLFRSLRPLFITTLVLISTVLLLIFSTGGIGSPLFFVLYFLLFAIALLFTPYQALITSVMLVAIFLWQNYTSLTSPMIVNLASLVLITPLAVIFSNSYLKYLESEGKITLLKEQIKDDQTESLLWIATTAKPSLASTLNALTDIVMYLNTKSQTLQIPKLLLTKIKTIQQDLISLYSSTGTLEKSIEESSDKIDI